MSRTPQRDGPHVSHHCMLSSIKTQFLFGVKYQVIFNQRVQAKVKSGLTGVQVQSTLQFSQIDTSVIEAYSILIHESTSLVFPK